MIEKAVAHAARSRPRQAEYWDASLPVFLQSWWLEAASTGRPSITVEATLGGRHAGRLLYATQRNKIGSRMAFPPFWSHFGGPILEPDLSGDEAEEALRQIVRQLPGTLSYRFACDPASPHIEATCRVFRDHGFRLEHDPTYLVFPDEGDILERMKSRHRAQIRSAGKRMAIVIGDATQFIAFYRDNLSTRTHSPLPIAQTIIERGIARGQMRVFLARNPLSGAADDPIDAAICCVWDSARYYYWMSRRRLPGKDGRQANPEATKLLILAAIQHAQSLGLVFDADSPESIGGRALFTTIFGIRHIEQRPILIRKTRMTDAYDRVIPRIKRLIRYVMPAAPIYDPRSTLKAEATPDPQAPPDRTSR